MKTQSFKTPIGRVHEIRLGQVLNMPVVKKHRSGIDLLDEYKGVEVKSSKVNMQSRDSRKRYAKWTLFDYQLSWGHRYHVPLYLALGTYQFKHPVSRIWTKNLRRLESYVTSREFWVVPWSVVEEGEIKKRKHHDYIYIYKSHLPPKKESIPIPKGTLHFTEGVDPSIFGV
jgi:hypothetical protein